MSELYIIENTDGVLKFTIQPVTENGPLGTEYTTDLRLFGNGSRKWGEAVDENFLRLAESFACPEKPGVVPANPQDSTDIGLGPNFGINKPVQGQLWFNKTDSKLYFYDGSGWATLTSASTDLPSDEDLYYDPNFHGVGIGQLMVYQTEGRSWKETVKAAATTNIVMSGAPQTIDGVVVGDGDRVLVMGQTNAADNGIYIASTGIWARADDMDSVGSPEEFDGFLIKVDEGTANGNGTFYVVDSVGTLGVDDVNIAPYDGWHSSAEQYLPLQGGTITGPLNVEAPTVFYDVVHLSAGTVPLSLYGTASDVSNQCSIFFKYADGTHVGYIGDSTTTQDDMVIHAYLDDIALRAADGIYCYPESGQMFVQNTGEINLNIVSTVSGNAPAVRLQTSNDNDWAFHNDDTLGNELSIRYNDDTRVQLQPNGTSIFSSDSSTDGTMFIGSQTRHASVALVSDVTSATDYTNFVNGETVWSISTHNDDFKIYPDNSPNSDVRISFSKQDGIRVTTAESTLVTNQFTNDAEVGIKLQPGINDSPVGGSWDIVTNRSGNELRINDAGSLTQIKTYEGFLTDADDGEVTSSTLHVGQHLRYDESWTTSPQHYSARIDSRYSTDGGGLLITPGDDNGDEKAISVVTRDSTSDPLYVNYMDKEVFSVTATTGNVICNRVFVNNLNDVYPSSNELVTKEHVDNRFGHWVEAATGSDTITGLIANGFYAISASGWLQHWLSTARPGFTVMVMQTTGGTVLKSIESTQLTDWTDGHPPFSATAIVQAPADGSVVVRMDPDPGGWDTDVAGRTPFHIIAHRVY